MVKIDDVFLCADFSDECHTMSTTVLTFSRGHATDFGTNTYSSARGLPVKSHHS